MRFCSLALLALTPIAALGQEKMKVTVVVILASEEGNKVDPRLKQIAEEIQRRDPQLKSFKLHSVLKKDLSPEEKGVFQLIDQKTVDVVIKPPDETDRVGLGVTAPEQGQIVYRTVTGKYLPIVTRYHTAAKERLIVALRVDPAK